VEDASRDRRRQHISSQSPCKDSPWISNHHRSTDERVL
jgi:hypothetical protein